MDAAAQASARAMQLLWFEWSGYRIGDTILQTGMTLQRGLIKGLKDRFLRTRYIPAFDLRDDDIEAVLQELARNPRDYFFGYASSLHVIARAAIEANISGIRFKHAVSWGDKLFPHYRKSIRQAFGCETIDLYGCTEGAMIAAQCRRGNYHLGSNQCFVEVVDDNGVPLPKGMMGRVLVTRLDNFAMPLIRYDIGDLAELEPDDRLCDCGRQFPRLRRIIGRDTDIVETPGGNRLIVHFFTAIFEHVPEIRQFKVVQRDLKSMEIQYIPGDGFTADILRQVEHAILGHLEEEFRVEWRRTSVIEPTPSGKPQIVQSLLKARPSFS
jgi:phenylacetate-CoA ligase